MTGIADAQHHVAEVGQRGRDDDLAAGIGEADRVADQILGDLAQRVNVGDNRRQRMRQRRADDDALAIGLWLHRSDALFDQVVEVQLGEGEVELAGLDPRQVEQVVDDRDHPLARGADVLEIFAVTLIAERAEPFPDHHFGKAQDCIQRCADLMADPRQHVGFGIGGAAGEPARFMQLAFAFFDIRQIAEHREEIRALRLRSSDHHRDRDQSTAAHARQHVAAVIEQAREVGAVNAFQIVAHRSLAFRREQRGEVLLHQFVAVIAEQRFGTAVA